MQVEVSMKDEKKQKDDIWQGDDRQQA